MWACENGHLDVARLLLDCAPPDLGRILGRRAGAGGNGGPAAALDMILTGKTVDAKRAQRMGLVTQAVPLRILEKVCPH
jgi:hypothetical protein